MTAANRCVGATCTTNVLRTIPHIRLTGAKSRAVKPQCNCLSALSSSARGTGSRRRSSTRRSSSRNSADTAGSKDSRIRTAAMAAGNHDLAAARSRNTAATSSNGNPMTSNRRPVLANAIHPGRHRAIGKRHMSAWSHHSQGNNHCRRRNGGCSCSSSGRAHHHRMSMAVRCRSAGMRKSRHAAHSHPKAHPKRNSHRRRHAANGSCGMAHGHGHGMDSCKSHAGHRLCRGNQHAAARAACSRHWNRHLNGHLHGHRVRISMSVSVTRRRIHRWRRLWIKVRRHVAIGRGRSDKLPSGSTSCTIDDAAADSV